MQLRVCPDALRIQVVTHRTAKEKGFLGNGGKLLPKGIESNLSKVDAVDSDLSLGQLDKSEQSLQTGTFSSACESDMVSANCS